VSGLKRQQIAVNVHQSGHEHALEMIFISVQFSLGTMDQDIQGLKWTGSCLLQLNKNEIYYF
jgi:hypothetical protein